jgi:hypothetical protein
MKKIAERVLYFLFIGAILFAVGAPALAQQTLYDNGPLITHPGDGAGGADASVLDTAAGMVVHGFGHQLTAGLRVADDFTVTAPGGWQIDQIVFYAFQIGAPTDPSTITAVNYQIWNGPPNVPGSSVVFGDTTTNRLVSSVWSNIYRVSDSDKLITSMPVMANTVSAGVHLPQGTYWLDWQSNGSLASGPWVPPITISGQTTTGDALQFFVVWASTVDFGTSTPQGLPFLIKGSSFCGTIGTQFTIPGTGFGIKKGKVLIGTAAAKIATDGWTDTAITATLTKPLIPGAYDVTIVAKSALPIVLPAPFNVMGPALDPLTTAHGAAGAEISVTGNFFSTKKGKVTLQDSTGKSKSCKVTQWSMDPITGESQLKFVVPKGLAPGAYPLTVTNKVGSVQTTFNVD